MKMRMMLGMAMVCAIAITTLGGCAANLADDAASCCKDAASVESACYQRAYDCEAGQNGREYFDPNDDSYMKSCLASLAWDLRASGYPSTAKCVYATLQ